MKSYPFFNPKSQARSLALSAFTLVELMVAMLVLVLLIVSVASLTNSATQVTSSSLQRIEVDAQARQYLDRIQADLTAMPKRTDLDCLFIKNGTAYQAGAGNPGNDRMVFFSNSPVYTAGRHSANQILTMQERNSMGLVGYAIDETIGAVNYQARRMGEIALWTDMGTFSGVSYLGRTQANITNGIFTPDPQTTISGQWSFAGGAPNFNPDFTGAIGSSVWRINAADVFRQEFCFLLKDGTFSTLPIMSFKDTSGNELNKWDATSAPTTTSQVPASAGARWWDATNRRAYICTAITSGGLAGSKIAVWQPYSLGDVSAVVVAIGLLDSKSRVILNSTTTGVVQPGSVGTVTQRWKDLVKLLPDAQPIDNTGKLQKTASNGVTTWRLPASTWEESLSKSSTFLSAGSAPISVVSQVRTYQRIIYIR